MAKQVYCVFDHTAEDIVGGLFVFTHDAPAIRIFVDGLNDPSTMLNKHPEDYSLVCLAEIEDAHGLQKLPILDGFERSRVVLSGAAWKSSQAEADS